MFKSVDDELGEECGCCGVPLDDQNRSGTEEDPMCQQCYFNFAFLTEWVKRGGTPEAKERMLEDTPNWIKRNLDLGFINGPKHEPEELQPRLL
jgi:hypothetical protein